MEYIVGLIALAAVIYLVTRKKEEVVVEAAPVEAKVEVVNAQPIVEAKPAAKPAAKKAAPKAAPKAAKKPAAAKKAPAKKAAPKKPKA